MVRVTVAAGLGLLAALLTGLLRDEWKYAPAIGWIVAAATYLAATWWVVLRLDAEQTAAHVRRRNEDGSPTISHAIVLVASVASLAGVGYLLAAEMSPQRQLAKALVGILSVIAAWFAIHTTFMLRYAELYYLSPERDGAAIDFHQKQYQPSFLDFAYLSFTVGMTYQVSDTDLKSREIRRAVLAQGLVSFLLGAVVLASTINLVLELAGR
jgi:uncharacterized membrane protein